MPNSPEQIERRFRAALAAIDGVVWTNNAAGEMIGEQPGWAELTGQTFDQYQGYGWSSAIHPDDVAATVAAWQKAVAAKAPFVFEHRLKRADRIWRAFAVNAIPIENAHGEIIEWLGVHRDVTDRRADEERLRQLATTFTGLVVSNPFGIYIVDADFRLAEVSLGARELFQNVDPLVGRDFAQIPYLLWDAPFAGETVGRFRQTLETGNAYRSPTIFERRVDTNVIEAYDWRIERIVMPDGRFGVVCYFYDLTERHAIERRLQHAVAEKDLLAREIDHRVKNSLMIVASVLSMQQSEVVSEEARRALADASDRVMAVARIHEGLHKSHALGVIAFGEYLERMCADVEMSIGTKAVKLQVSAAKVSLPADTALTLALIANELITNAFKHGVAAGAKVICVSLARSSDRLILTVGDDGVRLPQGAPLAKVGLGLNLVNAMVQQLSAEFEKPAVGEPMIFRIGIAVSEIEDFLRPKCHFTVNTNRGRQPSR